jgi:hypothetical protein
VALLVAPRHATEPEREEEVTLESEELGGQFAVGSLQAFLLRDRGVVVSNLGGHTNKEFEREVVGGLECFGALTQVSGDVKGI